MTGIKMSDVFELPMDTESSCGQKFLCDKEYKLADFCDDLTYGDKRGAAMAKAAAKAINAYDDNQERIKTLEHENALLENQLKNALAEIAELKKKARGY
tara:strand:- start:1394 stop:1690 length:297 start_codon:yes stop_codon:yes gene_type:complete